MYRAIPLFAVLWLGLSSMAGAETKNFTLTNMSAQTLTAFYVSASAGEESNVLTASLEPQGSADVAIDAVEGQCLWNFRIVFGDGAEQRRSDIDVCNIDGYVVE